MPRVETALLQLSDSQQLNVNPLPLLGHETAHVFVTEVTPKSVTDVFRQYLFMNGKHGDGVYKATPTMPEPLWHEPT